MSALNSTSTQQELREMYIKGKKRSIRGKRLF